MKLHVYDGELHVEFGVVPWKIAVEDETREIILYHGNRERYNTLEWKHGMLQHHYHRQNDVSKGTILGIWIIFISMIAGAAIRLRNIGSFRSRPGTRGSVTKRKRIRQIVMRCPEC